MKPSFLTLEDSRKESVLQALYESNADETTQHMAGECMEFTHQLEQKLKDRKTKLDDVKALFELYEERRSKKEDPMRV